MEFLLGAALILFVFFPLLFVAVVVLQRVLWAVSPLFFGINRFIWFAYNPLRNKMKDKSTSHSSILFTLLFYSLLVPAYWLMVHLALTPLRIITALYFDVLLYFSVMLGDLISELFDPKTEGMRYKRGSTYLLAYVTGFPGRFLAFLFRNILTVLDSLFMFSMGVVLPTFTLYHGTDFKRAVTNIAQKGQWLIGSGEFAGRGVYFGIEKKTAQHYARNYHPQGIIVARVTLSFVRNGSSLKRDYRDRIGSDGGRMSQDISPLWSTIEHWREGLDWWEYCLIHKGNVGDYIKTWRIRPVAFIGESGKPERLWKGQTHYCMNTARSFVVGTACCIALIPFLNLSIDFWSVLQ